MDKKEKSDDYDSPSDLWSVFELKKIFEAAKKSHQRKQNLLGLEWKRSVAQRSLHRWSPSVLVPFPCSPKSKFMLRLVVSVNIVNINDYETPFLFSSRLLFDAKVCVVSRGISKEAEQNTVTAQPCRSTDVPETLSETQSIGTKRVRVSVCV